MSEYSTLLGEAILRHRARVAEQSARIESELAGKVKSEFISNMSHELRTPLNTILGFSKLLREHDNRSLKVGEIVDYAHLIHDAAGHLLSVINDILDISKIQSGRYTLDAQEIDLDEIFRGLSDEFEALANEANVGLLISIARDVSPVRGDTGKLTQVFRNLISNAIKFSHTGGSVSIEGQRLSGGGTVITVRDTGVGMTPEEVEIALTPFGQVDSTHARWREGTGLGLPIAKALVDLHGGSLDIRSAKTMGTEISVVLPSPRKVAVIQDCDVVPANPTQPSLQ
ncbi:MAG: HAMP domain-containing sensor histidine kinase [Pseudomonadota bacterium]